MKRPLPFRSAHGRIDFADTDPAPEAFNIANIAKNGKTEWRKEPRAPLPAELARLIDPSPGEDKAEEIAPLGEWRKGF